MTKKNICVFCGASSGSAPDYRILAQKVGKIIGENNFNLIYGAGSTGLMGSCAKSAKRYDINFPLDLEANEKNLFCFENVDETI